MGWPSVAEQWNESIKLGIRIEICGACFRARGITEDEITQAGAQIGTPESFVENVEWSEKIIAE